MYISQCLAMEAAILFTLSRDQNRKNSNLQDFVSFLHLYIKNAYKIFTYIILH